MVAGDLPRHRKFFLPELVKIWGITLCLQKHNLEYPYRVKREQSLAVDRHGQASP